MQARLSENLRESKKLNVFKNRIRTMKLSELISENCQNCFYVAIRYVLYISCDIIIIYMIRISKFKLG